jgi:ADP-heptose:LPS heptosyltransferase
MGDVVLLVPVLRSLVSAYPNVHVTVATRPKFASFFENIERVHVFHADVDDKYKGFFGLRKLFRALIAHADHDIVIDMHDHLRTIFLRNLFKLSRIKVIVFDKGRKAKKAFTRKDKKVTRPLPHTVERYKQAFEKAGFSFPILNGPHIQPSKDQYSSVENWLNTCGFQKTNTWIGIAPFALHTSKIWPLANYPKLIELISKQIDCRIFFFGGGPKEIQYFEDVRQLFPERITVVAGQMKLSEEIALMQKLDLMLCTDSSNMHLAVLAGTPVLSIWGGTHPDVGFGPYQRGDESIIQIDRKELPCRPCSVFGKETCHRGDFACLNWITPDVISERIAKTLKA